MPDERIGFKQLRAAFFTLGCKVNQYETAALEQQFISAGFEIVEWDKPAEVYVVNSCTVTASGDKKSLQMLRRARRQSPDALVALCGCFPQAFPGEAASVSEADIVLGSKNRSALLPAVQKLLDSRDRQRVVEISPHQRGEVFEPLATQGFTGKTRAFIKIQDGCNRRCTYCIIPKARGPVRSKPLEEIRQDLEGLSANGYREAVLVGINLPSYGGDLGLRLLDAVQTACSVPGIHRVRLGSLEPELLSTEDIQTLAGLKELCPQFHLSLQSGCDQTLVDMRRPYDTHTYRRIVRDLEEVFPNCSITTDVMVGFPGETREHFEASMAFVREIGFARVHVFAYSPRPGTLAAKMPDQITQEEKQRRAKEMAQAANGAALAFRQKQVGRRVQVLFETALPDGGWEGYSENYTLVRVNNHEDLSGQIVEVEITTADEQGCTGRICKCV